jgi:hypothetical protein
MIGEVFFREFSREIFVWWDFVILGTIYRYEFFFYEKFFNFMAKFFVLAELSLVFSRIFAVISNYVA